MNADLTALYSALDSAETAIAFDTRDWARNSVDAWLYGIFVGWEDDPSGGNVDQDNALAVVAGRHGWNADLVDRLRLLRAAVKGFDLGAMADLTNGTGLHRALTSDNEG